MMADCGSTNRRNEKAQLQELNDRFCHYVQNVKCMTEQLGTADNSNDLKRIQELEEEMVAARNMYNKEIQTLHDQLDQNSKERMQIDLNNLKNSQLIAEFRESILVLNTAILQKEEEKKNLELMLCQKEAELRELKNNTSNPSTELDALCQELEKLRRCLEEVQKKYEVEHKQCMELQCMVQQLKHKLDIQKENHCQEMMCMRERAAEAEALIQELEEKLRRPNTDDGGAMEMVRKIREANEAEMRQFQRQAEQTYNQNLMELNMCLNKDRIQLEQIREENQCFRQHINNLSTEIKILQAKILSEEENKIALTDKMNCEQQKKQQHISDLKARLEEMEDLLLAKMKELSSKQETSTPSLQMDIAAFKCMLEAEERRLRDGPLPCCKKSSPCKSYLPSARTVCAPPLNQRAPAPSSCPPVNRSCPPPPISNPCRPVHRPCGTPSPAPNSWTPTTSLCCPPSSALTSRLPVYQPSCQLSPLLSCLPVCRPSCPSTSPLISCLPVCRPSCPSTSPLISCLPMCRPSCPSSSPLLSCLPACRPSCPSSSPLLSGLPVCRPGCPPSSPLALCASMSRPRCPSPPPLTSCLPANLPHCPAPSATCRTASTQPCLVAPVAYPKPCHPPEVSRFRHEQCMATECCNDEPKRLCSKPPTQSLNSCKFGQGRDYFNAMFKELKRDSICNKVPVCKPVINACNLNIPTSSNMGNIKIVEVAANGHFVRLLNISNDKEEDIGNHILQQNIGGHPVTVYNFPPRTQVKAGSNITVWAAGARVPHNPPIDLLWKECNKFGTGPECTTILCKSNGQAVAWFTPAPGNSKLNNPCKHRGQFTDYAHQVSTNDCQDNFQLDKGKEETPSYVCYFSSEVLSTKETPPVLLAPARCPWGQSTASATHPDFTVPRTQSMGNDGSSLCRDSRSQSSRPDPTPGNVYSGPNVSNQCRKSSSDKKSSTCSAANSSGKQQNIFLPGTFVSRVQQNCTAMQHLQSIQNLAFQPPMPRPPPVASW
ncbi:uncharacterized protein [Heptranchias perlo]|uniref:uncharacterized protein n=1 Tax=Heptranchias perlo TaxID=212740 RepID=UPI00355A4FE5